MGHWNKHFIKSASILPFSHPFHSLYPEFPFLFIFALWNYVRRKEKWPPGQKWDASRGLWYWQRHIHFPWEWGCLAVNYLPELPCYHYLASPCQLASLFHFIFPRSSTFFHEFCVIFLSVHISNIFCSPIFRDIYCIHLVTSKSFTIRIILYFQHDFKNKNIFPTFKTIHKS